MVQLKRLQAMIIMKEKIVYREERRGELGVMPVMECHNFRIVGTNIAKVIGFFSSPNVISTFEKVFMPANFNEFDTTKLLRTTNEKYPEVTQSGHMFQTSYRP